MKRTASERYAEAWLQEHGFRFKARRYFSTKTLYVVGHNDLSYEYQFAVVRRARIKKTMEAFREDFEARKAQEKNQISKPKYHHEQKKEETTWHRLRSD